MNISSLSKDKIILLIFIVIGLLKTFGVSIWISITAVLVGVFLFWAYPKIAMLYFKNDQLSPTLQKPKITLKKTAGGIFFIAVILLSIFTIVIIGVIVSNTFGGPDTSGFSTNFENANGGCSSAGNCEFSSATGGIVTISTTDDFSGKGADFYFSAEGKNFSSSVTLKHGEDRIEIDREPTSKNGLTDFSQTVNCERLMECQLITKINIEKGGYVNIKNLTFLIG